MNTLKDAPIPKSGMYAFVGDIFPANEHNHDELYEELIKTLDILYSLAERGNGQVELPVSPQVENVASVVDLVDSLFFQKAIHHQNIGGDYWTITKQDWNFIVNELRNTIK